MKNALIAIFIVFLIISGNFINAQENIDYNQYINIRVRISTSPKVQKLFDRNVRDNFENYLTNLFRKYFVDALLIDYSPGKITNESGLSTDCITAALDKYRNEVLIARTRQVDLVFSFDTEHHDHYGRHLTADKIEAKDVSGMNSSGASSFPNDKIWIFNAYTDFAKRVFNFTDSKTGCLFTTVRDFYLDDMDLSGDWEYTADKTFSIKSVMFHEIVHLALLHGDSPLANIRRTDEATVEDITLKIYPKEAQGFNAYEYSYNSAIWNWLYNKHDGRWFKFPYPQGRGFNPPVVTENGNVRLRYQPNDEIRVISQLSYIDKKTRNSVIIKDLKHQENTLCDDARCQDMIDENGNPFNATDFVIPYLCNWDPNTTCTSQMPASRSGSSGRGLGGSIPNNFPDSCCAPEPPEGESGGGGGSTPGSDYPDDTNSVASGICQISNLAPEAVILTNGYWQQALKLYGGLEAEPEFTANALFESTPFLIIPTGGLFGMENDATFKVILQEYVRQGGCIIVFDQQFGSHIDNLVPLPEGQSLHSYGWRQDQSCYNGSVYFKTMHPALSGLYNERPSAGLDGFISVYPANATVLLRKTINQDPALLYYPYGNGTVILTTLYTDYGHAHSQASWEELRLIRDLVTFAKNPNLDIPMFDLAVNPNPTVALNVRMKNSSEANAAKAKLKVFTPDRSKVLYEIEQNIALNASDEGDVQVEFNLTGITSSYYGICHTDYELYDAEGSLVQPFSESDGGRLIA